MKNIFLRTVLLLCILLSGPLLQDAWAASREKPLVLGIERVAEYADVFAGKKVGLITNQTGTDSRLKSSVDLLREQASLEAIFVPEHGLFGAAAAGEQIADEEYNGIRVHSLYGDNKKPTAAMLGNLDLIAFDIQDIGVRHYTYVSTMAYAMEACAENGKTFVVFDRPNPLGGRLGGPTLKKGFESFIGLYHVPLLHGMTVGEYARFINAEYGIGAELVVIPVLNWTRDKSFGETGLPWVPTSPNIPTEVSAFCYAATGIVGNMAVSVGIGTTKPFEFVGAPWMDKLKLAARLNALSLPGVVFRPAAFIPKFGMYKDELCQGVQLHITDKAVFRPALTGALLVRMIMGEYPQQELFQKRGETGYKIDISVGEASLRHDLIPLEQILRRWQSENELFAGKIEPYLLYPWGRSKDK